MACSNPECVEGRVRLDDETTAKGYVMEVCDSCTCLDCGTAKTEEGLCLYGCFLRKDYPDAKSWEMAAVRMQRAAGQQADPKMVLRYCRRRNYAARKCEALGGRPWTAISEAVDHGIAAGFSHVFESAVLH